MRTLVWKALVAASFLAWTAAVGVGFARLWTFAYTPGEAAAAASRWPSPRLQHDPARFTLVMVVHPECPCSRSSLAELERVIARTGTRLTVLVLFDVPDGGEETIAGSDLWTAAAGIPGVRPIVDPAGREADRFGARVSGQTFLYDAAGHLRFSGGITAARGHAGDNDGATAVVSIVLTGLAPLETAAVFGCSLAGRARP